jgi:hypothetical protein
MKGSKNSFPAEKHKKVISSTSKCKHAVIIIIVKPVSQRMHDKSEVDNCVANGKGVGRSQQKMVMGSGLCKFAGCDPKYSDCNDVM